MSTLAARGPGLPFGTVVGVVAALTLAAAGAAVASAVRASRAERLPPVGAADGPVGAYAVTYRVDTGGAVTTEEVAVERPFLSSVVVREGPPPGGRVVSRRSSRLGGLATISTGTAWAGITVPPAPASGDVRPELVMGEAVALGAVGDLGSSSVGGRPCRRFRFGGPPSAGSLVPASRDGGAGEEAVACIDRTGIVLEERWRIDGTTARVRRAVTLEVRPGAAVAVPAYPSSTEPVANDGRLRPLPAGEPPAVPAPLRLDPGHGFRHHGRFAVVPPDLEGDRRAPPSGVLQLPRLATVTDVWVRGPDVLLLDQGVSTGADPFHRSPAPELRRLDVAGAGPASLVLDLRGPEVRAHPAAGGFVRLAGTVTPDELALLASRLQPLEVGPHG